ncbi:hypothetical protein ACFV4T_36140 [Streptomyces sp. NPDC059755]|uniref:hypothetical protein n=1 Tax=Streptomyces sp. NPDC059755 TaxID=3346934 RepID=UPI00364A7199
MSTPGNWFVLIEETDTVENEFVVAKTIPVDGGPEKAWEAALDMARTHERFPGSRADCVREIYRLSERSIRVVLRKEHGRIPESFRVTVAELLEAHEPLAPRQDEDPAGKEARRWPRRRS